MPHETMKAGPVAGTDLRNSGLATYSEYQAQYISTMYALPPDTAATIAELAYSGGAA